jgi:hypothetical protein
MDSTDEKIHRKQQMIKEAEMKDLAKMKARDMAKARLDPNYQRDQMQAISSSDYENKPATSLAELQASGEKSSEGELHNYAQKVPVKNSF